MYTRSTESSQRRPFSGEDAAHSRAMLASTDGYVYDRSPPSSRDPCSVEVEQKSSDNVEGNEYGGAERSRWVDNEAISDASILSFGSSLRSFSMESDDSHSSL
jgi:hypothetical protein